MKHLKKKYVTHFQFNQEQQKEMNQLPDARENFRQLPTSEKADMNAFIFTEDGGIFQAFRYRSNGKTIMIPEPNPVVIYFDSARNYSQQLKKYREKVFENAKTFEENFVGVNGDFYWYFSLASSYAIFMFAAVEAFVNKYIPADFEYRREIQDKRVEIFNRAQIQRHIEFLEKIKLVIPQVKSKNFVAEFTHKFEYIKKLKVFRDEVAHTKTYEGGPTENSYENLYVMSLEFEYENTLMYMRDFINYYEPGLIEECNCGRED